MSSEFLHKKLFVLLLLICCFSPAETFAQDEYSFHKGYPAIISTSQAGYQYYPTYSYNNEVNYQNNSRDVSSEKARNKVNHLHFYY